MAFKLLEKPVMATCLGPNANFFNFKRYVAGGGVDLRGVADALSSASYAF